MTEQGTPDLVAYLRARIAEEEADALRIINAPDCTYRADWHSPSSGIIDTGDRDDLITSDTRLDAHIARWDPARVLAEVAAKRAVIGRYEAHDRAVAPHKPLIGDAAHRAASGFRHSEALLILLALAQVYAGRDDFPDEWRLPAVVRE